MNGLGGPLNPVGQLINALIIRMLRMRNSILEFITNLMLHKPDSSFIHANPIQRKIMHVRYCLHSSAKSAHNSKEKSPALHLPSCAWWCNIHSLVAEFGKVYVHITQVVQDTWYCFHRLHQGLYVILEKKNSYTLILFPFFRHHQECTNVSQQGNEYGTVIIRVLHKLKKSCDLTLDWIRSPAN